MRVTKTIEAYIREQVKTIVKKPTPAQEAYDAVLKVTQDAVEEANRKLAGIAEQIYAETLAAHGLDAEIFRFRDETSRREWFYCDLYNTTPMHTASNEERKNQQNEYTKAVQDIIVTLELGGNKADLDRMLAELAAK